MYTFLIKTCEFKTHILNGKNNRVMKYKFYFCTSQITSGFRVFFSTFNIYKKKNNNVYKNTTKLNTDSYELTTSGLQGRVVQPEIFRKLHKWKASSYLK